MRVAVDVTPLLDARTGVSVFTDHILRGLAAHRSIEPVAFSVSWRGRDRIADLLPPGVEIASRALAARPARWAWTRLDIPPIEWWTGPVDVVLGTNFVVPPARRAGRISVVHDVTAWRFPELCTADTRQYPRLVERAVRSGAHVVTASESVAKEVIARLGVPRERVHVCPLAPESVTGGDPGRGRDIGGDRYLLALGTVEPRKDLPGLVAAFDDVASGDSVVRLVIAGPDGWGVEALQAAIARARHRDRIVRVGWVDQATRADLLAGCTAFVYPSLYEGFGIPPLEAMTAGAPVVATAAGALPEVLDDAALLVPPGDRHALADGLARVLHDEVARVELVARGRERAANYTWTTTIGAMVEALQAAIPSAS